MDSMAIYYIIAAIVIILSGLVLKAYKVPEARVVRVRAPDIDITGADIDSLIERLEDIIADLDSARDE